MRLDRLTDVVGDHALSGNRRLRWLKRRVLGDPRKAPRRLVGVGIFLLILALVIGVLHLARTSAQASGSSFWLLKMLAEIVGTLWFAVPLAIYVYYKTLGRGRNRRASSAAEYTGWLTESIKQLSDAVRSTDHTTRLIVTSDDDYETIKSAVAASLDGESHRFESVDYYGRNDPPQDTEDPPALPESRAATTPSTPESDADDAAVEDASSDDPTRGRLERLWLFLSGRGDRTRRASVTAAVATIAYIIVDTAWNAIETAYTAGRTAVATAASLLGRTPASNDPDSTPADDAVDEAGGGYEIPWRVRFAEELKHFILDLTAAYRSDDIVWRFVLPAGGMFVTLLLLFRLWVTLPAFIVILVTSTLFGLGVFYLSKRVRSRRIKRYRTTGSHEHWEDVGGLVKTVETPDVTAYIGFMGGKSYASYDREEFVEEFSLRLWQATHDAEVSPSILEQYARNLGMMMPNLEGHKENIERPAIQRRIKRVVQETEDEVVEKAELAYRVIEPVDETLKFERELGHDPRLVAAEYRWLVEEANVLAEMDVSMPNAEGGATDLTLVYPSEKRRLPDVQQIHSRLSDRFHGYQGTPIYELPEVNPQRHIQAFHPGPSVLQSEELPDEGPNGTTTTPS